jgi:hypothetical protein
MVGQTRRKTTYGLSERDGQMALIRQLRHQALEKDSRHTEAECTYSIVTDKHGHKLLQIDTYGSNERKLRGKKSQSIRFSTEALQQLKMILEQRL